MLHSDRLWTVHGLLSQPPAHVLAAGQTKPGRTGVEGGNYICRYVTDKDIGDPLQRRFLSTGGHILNHPSEIVVRLDRRTYSPVLRQADLPDVTVPWLGDRKLRYEFA